LTAKDRHDLEWGMREGVDFVALSFVRTAADVRRLRTALARLGAVSVGVVDKLEKPEALEHLDAILAASDGVMIARGDLAVESSPEAVPLAQKRVIAAANAQRKLCITATEMLESMVSSPTPTRAEASDVANAILDGTDALMLSAETAVGRYPQRAVQMMDRIAREVEARGLSFERPPDPNPLPSFADALARAAHTLAARSDRLHVIALYTPHGTVARLLAKDRPALPVYAFTDDEAVARSLTLAWGVTPLHWDRPADTEAGVALMQATLRTRGWLRPGQGLVVLTRLPLREAGETNVLQLLR
jgi:pyruvate kinase